MYAWSAGAQLEKRGKTGKCRSRRHKILGQSGGKEVQVRWGKIFFRDLLPILVGRILVRWSLKMESLFEWGLKKERRGILAQIGWARSGVDPVFSLEAVGEHC